LPDPLFNILCIECADAIGQRLSRDRRLRRDQSGASTPDQEGPMTSDTTTAYDPLLRRIHWVSAVLFIAAMLIGFYCGLQQPGTSPRRELLEVHKSLGVTLFFLAILRLMVRAATTAPGEVSSFGPWVRLAARLNHWALISSCSRCRSPATCFPRPAAIR
jgi:Prokaryotic cytochrome b561